MNKKKQYVFIILKYSSDGEETRIIGIYSTKKLATRVLNKMTYYDGFTKEAYSLLRFPVQGIEVMLDLQYRKARMIKIHD